MNKSYIKEQRDSIEVFMCEKYNVVLSCDIEFDMIDSIVESIESFKAWESQVQGEIGIEFLQEIVSNYNHILVQGLLGLHSSSFLTLRRCLENILAFIYYSEHPVEHSRKELDVEARVFKNMEEMHAYIKEYPYERLFPHGDLQKLKEIVSDLRNNWKNDYKELSNYVHSSNSTYLSLNLYLEDLHMQEDVLSETLDLLKKVTQIINSLLLIYFYEKYKKLSNRNKSYIKSSIQKPLKAKMFDFFAL